MAGERKGKAYEALLKVVLEDLLADGIIKGSLFWNEKPVGMTIEPDFTIGKDPNNPSHVFLVTHSGSAKDSEKKFWRNIGELAELKTRLPTLPLAVSVAFDSVMKADLKAIQDVVFDVQLVVGDSDYGSELQAWIDAHASGLPKDSDEKVAAIRAEIRDRPQGAVIRKLAMRLAKDVRSVLLQARPRLPTLWALARTHHGTVPAIARDTFVRRGMMKAALLGTMPDRRLTVSPAAAKLTEELRLARNQDISRASLVGPKLADRDLVWLATSKLSGEDINSLVNTYGSDGFRRQILKVRSVAVLPHLMAYTAANLARLKTTKGMLAALQKLHANPGTGLNLPASVPVPVTLWMFDIVGAIVKAGTGKAQDFGYSTFAKHSAAARSRIGNMDIGTWCSCFMNQYFNRQPEFSPPAGAVEFCAHVLAEALSGTTQVTLAAAKDQIREQYIRKELEVGLLTHRGFDPVGALLAERLSRIGLTSEEITVQAGFAEAGAADGLNVHARSSGSTLLAVGKTGISWQSAHDSHTNDKRKELCGRALALKYGWDSKAKRFQVRPRFQRLLLVVDGTWKQDDLDALMAAGWDALYYPDEMDKLVKEIV